MKAYPSAWYEINSTRLTLKHEQHEPLGSDEKLGITKPTKFWGLLKFSTKKE